MKLSLFKQLYPALLITLVIVVAVSLLVASESVTRAVLESRQDHETLELLQGVFPEASFYKFDTNTEIYTLYNNGRNEIGYAFYGESWGYISTITVLVGLEDKETIRSIVVTSQKETEQYWQRLENDNFFDQFNGLKVEDCELKRYGGQLDAVTRATYSSRGVIKAVQETLLEKLEYIS